MAHGPHARQELRGDELVDAARSPPGVTRAWMRAGVHRALTSSNRPASAHDIAEVMPCAQGHRIAVNRLDRILDPFVVTHVARRVESANA